MLGTAGTERAYGLAARPAGASGRRRLHEGQPRRRRTPATRATTCSSPSTPRAANREWVTQVGGPSAGRPRLRRRDRRRRLDLRHRLHARRARRRDEPRRQGRLPARLAPTGGAADWITQFGTAGEDKGMAVATGRRRRLRRRHGHGRARHAAAGTTPGGSTASSRASRPRARRPGRSRSARPPTSSLGRRCRRVRQRDVAGYTSGDLFATQQGDKDIVVARFDPAGTLTLDDQLGTIGNDKGASDPLDGAGNTYSPASATATSGRTSATSTPCWSSTARA